MSQDRSRFGVVILTKDEAVNLPRCLAAIPEGLDIQVIDSGSTDATVEIALARGCKVLRRAWTGFADQRNFALESLVGEFDWIVFIDADEIFPKPIWRWAGENLVEDQAADVIYLSQRLYLGGRRLQHAPHYPIYHPRIVRCRPGLFLNNGSGHGETVSTGLRAIYLDIPYEHYIIGADLTGWLKKHVHLAQVEARSTGAPLDGVITRRAKLDASIKKGPPRAAARFLFHYVLCGGWRDGRPGFIYSALYGWYELTRWLAAMKIE